MIDEERTLEIYGYRSNNLTYGSGKKVVVRCDECGKVRVIRFSTYSTYSKSPDSCASCGRKGIVFSDEHKNNIRLVNIGRRGYWTGKKRSAEDREKMAAAKRGKKQSIESIEKRIKRGKDHYNWKGGITPDTRKRTKGILWRRVADGIRERDDNTCQRCGKVGNGKKLPVHHIIPFRVCKTHDPLNLITVCQRCHIILDKEYNDNVATGKYVPDNDIICKPYLESSAQFLNTVYCI